MGKGVSFSLSIIVSVLFLLRSSASISLATDGFRNGGFAAGW
jgi:hypothetical protein